MSDFTASRRPPRNVDVVRHWCKIAEFLDSREPLEVAIRYGNAADVFALLEHGRDCARFIATACGEEKRDIYLRQINFFERELLEDPFLGAGDDGERAAILLEAAAARNDPEITRSLNARLGLRSAYNHQNEKAEAEAEAALRLVCRRAETAEDVVVRWCRIANRKRWFHPLEVAVCLGNVEDARAFLEHGRDCVLSLGENNAMLCGYGPRILEGIRYDSDPFRYIFQNLVAAAAYNNDLELMRCLLSKGFGVLDVGPGRVHRGTALDLAILRGNAEMIRLLLEEGDDISSHEIMVSATLHGSIDDMKMLIRQGASLNSCREKFHDIHAIQYARSPVMLNILLDNGADVHASNSLFGSVIKEVKRNGRLYLVKVLTDRGAVDV